MEQTEGLIMRRKNFGWPAYFCLCFSESFSILFVYRMSRDFLRIQTEYLGEAAQP